MNTLPSFMADTPATFPPALALASGGAAPGAPAGGATGAGGAGAGVRDFAGLLAAAAATPAAANFVGIGTGADTNPLPLQGLDVPQGLDQIAGAALPPTAALGSALPVSLGAGTLPVASALIAPTLAPDTQPILAAPTAEQSGNFLPDEGAALPPVLPPVAGPVAAASSAQPPTPTTAAPVAGLRADERAVAFKTAAPKGAETAGLQARPLADPVTPDDLAAERPKDAEAPAEALLPEPALAADPAAVLPAPGIAPSPPPAAEPAPGEVIAGEPGVAAMPAEVSGAAIPAASGAPTPAAGSAAAAPFTAQLRSALPAGGRSELSSSPERATLVRPAALAGDAKSADVAADLPSSSDPAQPARVSASGETSSAASTAAPLSPSAPLTPQPSIAAALAPIPPAERSAEPAANAAAPAPTIAARAESAIDQVGALREALRSAQPAMTLQHAEFGTVALRIEPAAGDQWRAVLASRDPGFVPAIQAALAERALAPAAAADAGLSGQQHQHGASQNGASDQRYGASPNSGQGGSQPYLGQSGQRDGEAAPDHRHPSTAAALAARAEGEAEDPASTARATGGLFA